MTTKNFFLTTLLLLTAFPSYGNTPCEAGKGQPTAGRSQQNLVRFFDVVACKGVKSNISSDKITTDYCDGVFTCKNYQAEKELLSRDELELLDAESLDILVRETTKAEMGKYNSKKSKELNDLLAYISKMPTDIQAKIQKCEKIDKPDITACLGSDNSSTMVRLYIETSLNKETKVSFGQQQSLNRARQYQGGNKKMSFEQLLNNDAIQGTQNLFLEKLQSSHFDIENDSVLNSIYDAVIKSGATDSKEIKKIVRAKLLNASMNSNDYILKFDNVKTASVIDKSLAAVKSFDDDFDPKNKTDKKSLLEKLNKIRVALANSHLSDNCDNTVRSLHHVCSNITKNIKSGKTLDLLLESSTTSKNNEDKLDPFDRMIEYYRQSDIPKKDKKIKSLLMMKEAQSKVYHKFLQYTLQAEVCTNKFSDIKNTRTKKRSQAIIDKLSEMKMATEISRQEAIAVIANTAKTNQSFKDDMDRLGIKLDTEPLRSEVIASNNKSQTQSQSLGQEAIKQSLPSQIQSTDSGLETKSASLENNPNEPSGMRSSFESSSPENSKNFGSFDSYKNDKGPSIKTSDLRSMRSELEAKEKLLAEKAALEKLNSNNDNSDKAGDELVDLRRQVDELKKSQASSIETRSTTDGDVNALKSQNSKISNNSAPKNTFAESEDRQINAVDKIAASNNTSISNIADSRQLENTASAAGGSADKVGTAKSSKANGETSVKGIVLSKTGEVMQDAAAILDNPKEGEIVRLLEATNGQPFLIRENGVLIQITLDLDAFGKPQILSGKPRYKKERLTKAQEESIAKYANLPKAMKEITGAPTRLFDLKALLNNSVKRE